VIKNLKFLLTLLIQWTNKKTLANEFVHMITEM